MSERLNDHGRLVLAKNSGALSTTYLSTTAEAEMYYIQKKETDLLKHNFSIFRFHLNRS